MKRLAQFAPRWVIWTIAGICLAPMLLQLLGVDFGSPPPDVVAAVAASGSPLDNVHHTLAGSFIHVLLEWSAFCVALVTAVLAFMHFRITRDVATPVIGTTLFCAGVMDGFHALAAVHLMDGTAHSASLIPFTWALSRMFAALILVVGISVVLIGGKDLLRNTWWVVAVCVGLALISYVTIHVCVSSPRLPQTMYPYALISRPFDVIPLVLFAIVAGPLAVIFNRKHPSVFSKSLILSLAPAIAVQAYMAFGSRSLFDSSFAVAHAMKIVTLAIPLIGLILDYERLFHQRWLSAAALRRSEERFEVAVRGTSDGLWDWEPGTDRVWYAPRFKELLGYGPADDFPGTIQQFNRLLHPDDHDRVWQAVGAHLDDRTPYDIECRLQARDGEYRWFRARGQAKWDESGRAVRMAGSIQDNSASRTAESAIREANEDLQRANDELEQFVYSVSHDLKSPLATIQGFMDHMQQDLRKGRNDRLGRFASKVEMASTRMRRNIDDLLELSRAGRVVSDPVPVDPAAIVQTLADEYGLRLQEAGVTLRVESSMPVIVADETRIHQVFENLFVNALKYGCTDAVPSIEIGAEIVGDEIQYYVRDNGQGVAEPHRERVFELFHRLDENPEGTGIGLAIVKRIVELHGGRVWATDAPKGGAEFRVALPATLMAAASSELPLRQ